MIGLVILLLCTNISEGEKTGNQTDISWKRVTQHTQLISADLEMFDLHLKTSSLMRSNDAILVLFYNKEERAVGGIRITFSYGVRCDLLLCRDRVRTRPLPSSLSAQIDKHWVINKSGQRIEIYCNGVLVLEQVASLHTCYEHTYDQRNYWGQNVRSIRFSLGDRYDTATEYYYIDSVSESDETETKTESKKISAAYIIIIIGAILVVIVVGVYVYQNKRKDETVRNNIREEPVYSVMPNDVREVPVYSAPPDNMREEPVFSAPPDNMREEPVFPDQTLSNFAPPKYEEFVRTYGEENVPSYEDVMGNGVGYGVGHEGGYGDDGDGGGDDGGGYGGYGGYDGGYDGGCDGGYDGGGDGGYGGYDGGGDGGYDGGGEGGYDGGDDDGGGDGGYDDD